MRSLINKKNCHSLPFFSLLILIFLYLVPNIKYPSIGENSLFTALIFILSYSLHTYREIRIYIIIGILCFLFPFYSILFLPEFGNYSIISSAMSLYIITVPVISSISIGRIIGYRYAKKSNQIIRKEFYLLILFLGLLFGITAFLENFAPDVIYFFLHAGRTSHSRSVFFFTEPSQSSIILIGLFSLGVCFFFKNRFSMIFSSKRKLLGSGIIFGSSLLIYLIQPLTFFGQLFLLILIFIIILITNFIYQIIKNKIIKLRILGFKKSFLFFAKISLLSCSLFYIVYFLATNYFSRISSFINLINREGIFLGLMLSGGTRFYWIFVSVIEGFKKPLSIPGDWVGNFYDSLINIISNYGFLPPDFYNHLQLYKQEISPLVLKPAGWLYFGIYDLGVIGILFVSFFLFKKYLLWSIRGIIECDKFIILLVSAQASFLLMPLLPTTPFVFLPLSLAAIRFSYQEKIILKKN